HRGIPCPRPGGAGPRACGASASCPSRYGRGSLRPPPRRTLPTARARARVNRPAHSRPLPTDRGRAPRASRSVRPPDLPRRLWTDQYPCERAWHIPLVARERAPPGHDLRPLLRVERILVAIAITAGEKRAAVAEIVLIAGADGMQQLVRDHDAVVS